MDLIKSLEEVEKLINLLENGEYLGPADRHHIAHYIRFSAPFEVIKAMEKPVFDVIEKCEDKELFTQETHDARNALTRLYGFQVLQLI